VIKALRIRFGQQLILRSLNVIPPENRFKILLALFLQVGLSLLDLLGVAAIGVLGALSVTGIQSNTPGSSVLRLLEILRIDSFSFQSQVGVLGVFACLIFVIRTALSILTMRKILFFLSKQGALISSSLLNKLLSQPLLHIQSRSTQETVYSLTIGVTSITLGILGTAIAIVADSAVLLVLIVALLVVDPLVALISILFFGFLGLILYRVSNIRAQELGRLNSSLSVKSNEKIVEVLDSYRESVVRNTRQYYSREFGKSRLRFAEVLAEIQFLPNISKYVIESGVMVGAVMIAAIQFSFQDARQAVATFSVFLAASTRIAPATLRLQQNAIQIKSAIGTAEPTLAMVDSLIDIDPLEDIDVVLDRSHPQFEGNVTMNNVILTYPSKSRPALDSINLDVKHGETLALVGPSGAGKTTLVDVLLGVLSLDAGEVTISGEKPRDAIKRWPGAIAYVPQNVTIVNGTIRENVALGFSFDETTDLYVRKALDLAQLGDLVAQFPEGLDSQVGERGSKLSGGQRQRLGIARAMFTNPRLIILDEATSSLDSQTEFDFFEAIRKLRGQTTVILISHRLSTVRDADQVLYLSNGSVISKGTFEEVRISTPDFDFQSKLNEL